MKSKILKCLSIMVQVIFLTCGIVQSGVAMVQSQTTFQEPVAIQPTSLIDRQELETFLNGLLASEMTDNHTPGVMIAVVEDGNLLLAKGYGYADLEGQVLVDPDNTLFRVGSVSKLFTWTAVMQLLEQGKLSLDTDINEYLDFAIPATYSDPITLRHLLSHTPGFEFNGAHFYRLQAEQMIPLGDWIKANLPARVFPPGEVAAYSNYGAALAGYIVERVSGLAFNEYVEHNIFSPLGMTHSTFRQPLPRTLSPNMATGYNYTNEYIEGSFIFQLPYPAGALSTTAADMARFMIAHLQNGELNGQRILQEQTALQMHSQLYTPDPRIESLAHGFFEKTENGQRLVFHTGSLTQFHSGLWLIPEQNVGLFISTNSTGGFYTVEGVKKAFLDHYYPIPEPTDPKSTIGFSERIAPYLGQYTQTGSSFTTYEKIYGAFSPTHVSLENDGTLVVSQPGRVRSFIEVEPGLLQEIGEPDNQWIYGTGPNNRLFLMESGPYPIFKTPWYGTGILHLLLFLSGTLLFLGVLIAWLIGFVANRRRQPPAAQTTPLPARLARWTAAIFGLLWIAVLLGIMSIFIDILPAFGAPRIIFEDVPLLNILLALSYVLGGLALVILVFAVLAWVRRYWSLGGRILYTLLSLMALLLTWVLVYWNLFL